MKLLELSRAAKIALLRQLFADRLPKKATIARALRVTPNTVGNWLTGRTFPTGEAEVAMWRYWGLVGDEEIREHDGQFDLVSANAPPLRVSYAERVEGGIERSPEPRKGGPEVPVNGPFEFDWTDTLEDLRQAQALMERATLRVQKHADSVRRTIEGTGRRRKKHHFT
jgi:hypothetical protein